MKIDFREIQETLLDTSVKPMLNFIHMIETEYFTTKDVSEKTNKSPYAILKYARTKTTIKTEGEANQKRYYWTENDINEYKQYLENLKDKSYLKVHHKLKDTNKLDSYYKRLNRAIKNGEIERAELIRAEIKEKKDLLN